MIDKNKVILPEEHEAEYGRCEARLGNMEDDRRPARGGNWRWRWVNCAESLAGAPTALKAIVAAIDNLKMLGAKAEEEKERDPSTDARRKTTRKREVIWASGNLQLRKHCVRGTFVKQ